MFSCGTGERTWIVGTMHGSHRTRDPLYEVLVIVLLLPPVEFVVVGVITVHGMGVGDGRHVPLFSLAFIRGRVFGQEERANMRIVSRKELELGQEVFGALEIRGRAAGACRGRQMEPEAIGVRQTSDAMRRLTRGGEIG